MKNNSAVFFIATIVIHSIVCTGCGRSNSDGRVAVSGAVMLDGKALEGGQILFRPQPGQSGPSAQDIILNGRFSISAARGPGAGPYAIVIKTGFTPGKSASMNQRDPQTPNAVRLPPQSFDFTREITDIDGLCQLDFVLESGGAKEDLSADTDAG